jgi:hypothetical protein
MVNTYIPAACSPPRPDAANNCDRNRVVVCLVFVEEKRAAHSGMGTGSEIAGFENVTTITTVWPPNRTNPNV